MRTRLVTLWDTFRTGFWFFPSLLILAAVMLAVMVPIADQHLSDSIPDWMKSTGTSARSTLASLASAMFTVAGVVFSVTVVTFSLTSSQFGPRLLRNFLEQSVTQVTLGVCLAASLYCLLLLWQVAEVDGETVVPHIGVLLATVFAMTTLFAVVYFIHRVAHSVQSMNVVTDVAKDLDSAIERIFPAKEDAACAIGPEELESIRNRFENLECDSIPATKDGYLQAVSIQPLSEIAEQHGLYVLLVARPGDFVVRGLPLAKFVKSGEGDAKHDDDFAKRLSTLFLIGNIRTPRQDVECAINELAELAVRALSPGINDPFTAMASVDRLTAAYCRLADRDVSCAIPLIKGEQEQLRIAGPSTSFDSLLHAGFDQIRQYGAGSVAVSIRLLESLARIAKAGPDEETLRAIRHHAEMIVEGCEKQVSCQADLDDIRERYLRVVDATQLASNEPPRTPLERSDTNHSATLTL
ncbi:DUF2254 domain-containing protein [Aeoliella sp. SH292]|uniref:DUF2254 domain-containing protein n=1 Tax=Aeoliella sp. SH292 TaxID=3454464 RepID=UPI003F9A5B2A